MHELSIAENIVEIIHQHVDEDRLRDVRAVGVKVGTYSGVVADSLEFSYQAITAATPLEQSFLALEQISFVVECEECNQKLINDDGVTQCSSCGSFKTKIISGRELQVKDIELEDVKKELV
ncbi:MAG: hydrogenase maturation nickel metallochaperone HypA [Bacteroidota bacterium]|nr:hydrogenase maturation nickel metallochaperone HypA [Bacteroidota bacterium]